MEEKRGIIFVLLFLPFLPAPFHTNTLIQSLI
jgi:hypothetical protein